MEGTILVTDNVGNQLQEEAAKLKADQLLILTDTNVKRLWETGFPKECPVLAIAPGENSKNLDTASQVWRWLAASGATRRSVLACVGGGVVTDLGGFCASTYMRGISCLNVPTTVLAMADAAIGGKTGIDFDGRKNLIGTFSMPKRVIINGEFLTTLPRREVLSGLAETVKMALIGDPDLYHDLLRGDPLTDSSQMERAITQAAKMKLEIVAHDPLEKELRKVLNFGHTFGHAYESAALEQGCPITHGEGVARGILDALKLSRSFCGLGKETATEYEKDFLMKYFGEAPASCQDPYALLPYLRSDKKGTGDGSVDFVLLESPGRPIKVPLKITDLPIYAHGF